MYDIQHITGHMRKRNVQLQRNPSNLLRRRSIQGTLFQRHQRDGDGLRQGERMRRSAPDIGQQLSEQEQCGHGGRKERDAPSDDTALLHFRAGFAEGIHPAPGRRRTSRG